MASTADTNVSAELEIRNIIGRLSQLADRGLIAELDDYVDCFTEDGIFETPMETRTGAKDIREGAAARRWENGPEVQTRHIVGSTDIRFTGPDDAIVESNFVFGGPGPDGRPGVLLVGHYDDVFRRTDAGWRLAHRRISFS
jgi:ketosteroid isomerase-like protein